MTSIDTLAGELMVDDWLKNIDYDAYFAQCRPLVCSYSYTERFNILYIITTMMGLFGGLTTTLRFIAPRLTDISDKITKYVRSRSTNPPATSVSIEPHQSFRQYLYQVYIRNKNTLLTLNLYIKRDSEISAVRKQIISTRLYIGFLFFATLILVLVTGLAIQTKTVIVTMPSLVEIENLFDAEELTLSCPCSNIAIAQSTFLSLTPTFHQICSSDFLSDDWLDRLVYSTQLQSSGYYYLDIRSYGFTMFRSIRTFCTVANTTIMDALVTLYATQLISIQTLSREQFQEQIQARMIEFQINTPNTFKQLVTIARETINGNQLLTTKQSNFFAQAKFNTFGRFASYQSYLGIKLLANDTLPSCSCLLDTCTQQLGFYNGDDSSVSPEPLFTIPGILSACYPFDGLRLSTLECWFNETCISLIRAHLTPISVEQYIPALKSSIEKRFTPSTLLGDIIDELMIEEWTNTTDYEAYYSSCRPLTCTYTYFHRLDWLYTVTTLIALFGGLSVSFRIICPLLVKCYAALRIQFGRHRILTSSDSSSTNVVSIRLSIVARLKRFVITINLFDSDSPDADVQRQERLSTRLYVVSLVVITMWLFIYMLFIEHNNTVIIKQPSTIIVARLQERQPLSLSCPCSQAAMPYSTFLSIKVDNYHSVCSSPFIAQPYMQILMGNNLTLVPESTLFRRQFLAAQLSLLSSLCTFVNQTMNASLGAFNQKQFISSAQVLTIEQFHNQINSTIDQFSLEMALTLNNTLDYLQAIIHGSGIMSSYFTNWDIMPTHSDINPTFWVSPVSFGNCSCAKSSNCSQLLIIGNISFSGLYIGCLPLPTLLQSTLECFYDQTCLDTLHDSLFDNMTLEFLPVSLTKESRFPPNTSVKSIVDELFVENWSRYEDYDDYFRRCLPSICTYMKIQQFDILYVVTTIISLVGGLTIALRLICPLITRGCYYLKDKIQGRRGTNTSVVQLTTVTATGDVLSETLISAEQDVSLSWLQRNIFCKKVKNVIPSTIIVTCVIATIVIPIVITQRSQDMSKTSIAATTTLQPMANTSTVPITLCSANASWSKQGVTVVGFADGTGSGSLDGLLYPFDLLVDAIGNMHILDQGNNRIVYWPVNAKQGRVIAGNGAPNAEADMISAPSFFVVGRRYLYVVDSLGGRVQAFPFTTSIDSPNATTMFFALTFVSNIHFNSIILILSMAFNWNHDLFYMSNQRDNRLLIWNVTDDSMQLIDAVTLVRSSDMASIYAFRITVDEVSDVFYVYDANTYNIYKFEFGTMQGIQININFPNSVSFYLTNMRLDSPDIMYCTDDVNDRVVQIMIETGTLRTIAGIGLTGTSATRFTLPQSSKFDGHYNLYVADTYNNRIQRFELVDNGC